MTVRKAKGVRLTQEGIKMVDLARKRKGWNKYASVWAFNAFVSESTLKRFITGKAISPENFKHLCRVVGIYEWESLVDWEESDSTALAQLQGSAGDELSEELKSKSSRVSVTGVFTLDKRLEVEMALEHLKQLLLDCKLIIKSAEDSRSGLSIYGFFSPDQQLEIEIVLEHLKQLLVSCTITII